MMKEYSRLIKNDGSEVFRKCVIDYCLSPKVMPIHISKEDVEQLVDDKNLTVIFEKGDSLQEMTEGIGSCKDRFSRCILKMVYLKYHPDNKPRLQDVHDRNGFCKLFANTENPLWGLAADDTIITKMEMMFAYSPKPLLTYEVIKIKDYADFMRFQNLADEWCITYGEDIFNLYAKNGQNALYVLKRNDAESIPKQYGDGFPKDSYGLSFIAVYVDAAREIINVTSRWNTIQEDDHFLSVDELKQLLGGDFSKIQ
ncbi:MAG: hypothetical protein IJ647_04185 [Prevotella sp.]|nr:hypothetical protein [Prevotella sp.]